MNEALEKLKKQRGSLLREIRELDSKFNNQESEAREVFDLIFRQKFKRGGKWLERTKKLGRRNAMLVNLLGGVRHLYGHLHPERHVQAAMDRRGPNSIIQGPASNLGFVGGYLARKVMWEFYGSRGIDLGYRVCNTVHDSTEAEVFPVNIPLVNYICDHAYTTLLHAWMRDVMHFEPTISFEMDSQIGPSLAEMKPAIRWDETVDAIEAGLKWSNENLGREEPIELIMPIVKKNAIKVFKIRRHEIKRQLERDERVSYYMYLNAENCMKQGFIFDTPVKAKLSKGWEKEIE